MIVGYMADQTANIKSEGNSSFKFYANVEVKNLAKPSLSPLPESVDAPRWFNIFSNTKRPVVKLPRNEEVQVPPV